jgi:outer membrane lipoprotein-sorting protein
MKKQISIMLLLTLFSAATAFTQTVNSTDIVKKAYYNVRSENYSMNISMKVVRPSWSRELTFKSYTKGANYGMMVINAPAKDKGISFLRIKSEGWNWLPAIERVIKISPSQMSQSWMGSDFTNEDLLKEASIVNDYTHSLLGEEKFQDVNCYKIQATPKANAAVVWGKIILWISKDDILQRKAEYYDEDGKLINTLVNTAFKTLDGKKIATTLEMTPGNKKGQKTIVTISAANFAEKLDDSFFSTEKMKTEKYLAKTQTQYYSVSEHCLCYYYYH